jgi:hypothetical protein
MARDVATVQTISDSAGVDITMTAFVQANGGQYDNTNQTAFMIFINTGTAKVITISTDKTFSDQDAGLTSKTFALPATSEAFIMPVLQNQWWAQDGTTNIHVDIDADTGVTWAVIQPA